MNNALLQAVTDELRAEFTGRATGKIWQLSSASFIFDFRDTFNHFLFLSVETARPRLYAVLRRQRDIEKAAIAPTPFVFVLQKKLAGATLERIEKDVRDRIIRFYFFRREETGAKTFLNLIAQLSGRSANLFLSDAAGIITQSLRESEYDGQRVGEIYCPPQLAFKPNSLEDKIPAGWQTDALQNSLSARLDEDYLRRESENDILSRAQNQRRQLNKTLTQYRKLSANLTADARARGSADEHKYLGDLLLANAATARRLPQEVILKDYFAENEPELTLPLAEDASLTEEAARHYKLYGKAKRAGEEAARRLADLQPKIATVEAELVGLDRLIAERDFAELEILFPASTAVGKTSRVKAENKPRATFKGARRYQSSDGYEILVGRAARDNDELTFKIARPNDLWLHAADYPGSHVIVRNFKRDEIPQRTVLEAAQLAAHFSQAKNDAKVDVRYALRKFISKPKGGAPGLVRLTQFRSLTVAPANFLPPAE